MKALMYSKLFRLACWLIKQTVKLDLATIGIPADGSKISMLIFTTPGLAAKALIAANYIADGADGPIEISSTGTTVH
jgi:hypothetical protein